MIRVLLLGFAGSSQADVYLPAFRRHQEFSVVATCAGPGDSGGAAKKAAAELDIPQFEAVADAARSIEFDAVCVAVTPEHRVAVHSEALRVGKHVLAVGSIGSPEVAALAERSGRVLLPASHERLGGAVRAATAAIAAGRIGLPWNIQADFFVVGGRGELADVAAQPVDVLQAMLGLEPIRVYARSGNSRSATAADFLALLIDYEHGVTGTVTAGRTLVVGDSLHRYRASGSHGVLLTDADKPALTVRGRAGLTTQWRGGSTVDALLDLLHQAITGAQPPWSTPALHVQTVLDTAQRSLRSGLPERCSA
jgi:predicted dehydrogenase